MNDEKKEHRDWRKAGEQVGSKSCDACGRTIIFIKMPSGKRMPVDAHDGRTHFETCTAPKRFRQTGTGQPEKERTRSIVCKDCGREIAVEHDDLKLVFCSVMPVAEGMKVARTAFTPDVLEDEATIDKIAGVIATQIKKCLIRTRDEARKEKT